MCGNKKKEGEYTSPPKGDCRSIFTAVRARGGRERKGGWETLSHILGRELSRGRKEERGVPRFEAVVEQKGIFPRAAEGGAKKKGKRGANQEGGWVFISLVLG